MGIARNNGDFYQLSIVVIGASFDLFGKVEFVVHGIKLTDHPKKAGYLI